MSDSPYTRQTQATGVGAFNRTAFLVQQILDAANIATLVQVVACSNDGGLTPTGTVDVLPLVNQLDGNGRPTPHAVVHGLLYFRLQGGTDAVVVDPKPGDIGIAVFSDRDLSSVKAARGQANPGSFRRNDYADGMYIGGWSATVPTQFVQFTDAGIAITSPSRITLQAPVIELTGDVRSSEEITARYGTPASVTVSAHNHDQPPDSHGDVEQPTDPPTPGS